MIWQNKLDMKLGRRANWADYFEYLDADGVDFITYNAKLDFMKSEYLIDSFTKEEMIKAKMWPRSNYAFWKKIDGIKFYLIASYEEN